MIWYFLLLISACPKPQIINETINWTSNDTISYNSARINCVKHYPKSPCLKKFIKKEYQTYWAICGKGTHEFKRND